MVEKNGKYSVEKLGLKGITRDGMDYEFTIVFDLDIKHNASASKDRTGLFMDKPEGIITPEYGKRILQWCEAGTSLDEVIGQIRTAKTVEKLREIYNNYPEYRTKIESLAIARKQEINAQIINQTKIGNNGTEKR